MKIKERICCRCTEKRNIAYVSTIVLMGLFMLDVIFKGQIYQRLPVSWQNKLSEWIGR